jgi:hypothetical protein
VLHRLVKRLIILDTLPHRAKPNVSAISPRDVFAVLRARNKAALRAGIFFPQPRETLNSFAAVTLNTLLYLCVTASLLDGGYSLAFPEKNGSSYLSSNKHERSPEMFRRVWVQITK